MMIIIINNIDRAKLVVTLYSFIYTTYGEMGEISSRDNCVSVVICQLMLILGGKNIGYLCVCGKWKCFVGSSAKEGNILANVTAQKPW
jgi:hypothetical protein